MLKRLILGAVVMLMALQSMANESATDAIKVAVDQLISIAEKSDLSTIEKKDQFEQILMANFDFKAMAVSIVAQKWRVSDKVDQERFIELFRQTMVNTYFDLFQQYTNEKVSYLSEKIRKERYAVVETEVLSKGVNIPVTYKLLLRDNKWRAYDFVVEGISLIRSYNENYKPFLHSKGLAGLNIELEKKLAEVDKSDSAGG